MRDRSIIEAISSWLTSLARSRAVFPSESPFIGIRKGSNTYAERQFVWGMRFVDDLVWRDRDADGDGSHTLEERLDVLNDYFHVTALANTSGVV